MLEKLFEIYKELPEPYQKRLKAEIDVVTSNSVKDFMPYFITLADIIDFCNKNNILVGPTRGSGGGFLINYLLGLTALDPVKYDLPLSRFLSHARLQRSIPDLDIDFPTSKRELINNYIFEKYGDRAALVAAFALQKLKNSLLDSWRIHIIQPSKFEIETAKQKGDAALAYRLDKELEKKTEYFNSIRKSLGTCPAGISDMEWLLGYEQDGEHTAGLLESHEEFIKFCESYPQVFETAKEILGVPRNLSVHAAGVVIADRPLYELCPVMKIDGKNVIVYDKKTVAKIGLVKNDNLGLTTLDWIQNCLDLIGDPELRKNIWDLPEDIDVYKEFLDGHCRTLFQHDTLGGARFAQKLKPVSKQDLFASVALNRPGALDAKIKISDTEEVSAADAFILRKQGKIPVEFLHDDLKPILSDTQGIFAYQEQIMKTIQMLLGFSEEESVSIRSAISDKNPKGFEAIKERLPLLKQRGWSDAQISEFFQQIEAFSRYSFNLSHSAGYGTIAYVTAYLKHKYPLQWWTAVLSSMAADEIIEKMWPEVHKLIERPSVNESRQRFAINNGKLIPPLKLISNVGPKAIEDIAQKAPFKSFEEFVERIDGRVTNKRTVINLILSGALDNLLEGLSMKDKLIKYLELKAKKEKKKKIEEIDIDLENLTPLTEFLLSKKIFPVKNLKLSKIVEETQGLNLPFVKRHVFINGKEELAKTWRGEVPLVDGDRFTKISNEIKTYGENYVDICCFGYVVATRKFSYFSKKLKKEKEAFEVTIDIDNHMLKIVCWPRSAEFSPKITHYLKDQNVYLFKIRINQDDSFKYGIVGVEEII